jgi:uncharacterized protein (DUF4415 family)
MSSISKGAGSSTSRTPATSLLERAKAARDAITDDEDARIRAAAQTDADARPVDELLKRKRGRPKLANAKQPVLLRLDRDVVERFKAGGEDWQTRMNKALRKAANLD